MASLAPKWHKNSISVNLDILIGAAPALSGELDLIMINHVTWFNPTMQRSHMDHNAYVIGDPLKYDTVPYG